MHKKNWKIFYPILFGIYAVVGLLAVNVDQIRLAAGLRSLLLALLFSVGVYALFTWRLRNAHKAALLCTWFLLFFFGYGHVYAALEGMKVLGANIGRHRYLFPTWVVLFAVGGWLLYSKARVKRNFSRAANIISTILLLIPAVQVGMFEWQKYQSLRGNAYQQGTTQQGAVAGQAAYPDIYYIILDSYGRADILKQYYHLDIYPFVDQLKELGFYVVACAQSNYGITDTSMASSLNMNYIDQIVPARVENQPRWFALGEPIRDSLVRRMLTEEGYKTVAFNSAVWWSQLKDADYYFDGTLARKDLKTSFWLANSFEVLFLRTTVLRVALEASNAWMGTFYVESLQGHAQYVEYTLTELANVPPLPNPKFVFVHLMAPHAPYVFNPDGDFVYNKNADPGYPDEIEYLNKRLLPLVEGIIRNSRTPPIIILQGDHGLDNEVRLAIFNAILFPGDGAKLLYPTMTPVNTFRLLFSHYFGKDLPLLPDVSYYSAYGDYYNFTEVKYPCTR
jgi:hypothetical protein